MEGDITAGKREREREREGGGVRWRCVVLVGEDN